MYLDQKYLKGAILYGLWGSRSHMAKSLLCRKKAYCFDSFSAHIRLPLIQKGHSHVLLIDLSLRHEFPFLFESFGVKQQTNRYSGFKREKSHFVCLKTLYRWFKLRDFAWLASFGVLEFSYPLWRRLSRQV